MNFGYLYNCLWLFAYALIKFFSVSKRLRGKKEFLSY